MMDYTELVKALRFETDYVAVEKTMRDAAAAIEELQAEVKILKVSGREAYFEGMAAEPKRGEWIHKDAELYYWHECSKCGERPLYDRYANKVLSAYCPNCGAKMEVQDADR